MSATPDTTNGTQRNIIGTCSALCRYVPIRKGPQQPDEGQIKLRLSHAGWEIIKGRMVCPSCRAKLAAEATEDTTEIIKGVMPGWVAEMREELFGPDNGNEDMIALAADLKAWREQADTLAAQAKEAIAALSGAREEVKKLVGRLEHIKRCIGAKASRA